MMRKKYDFATLKHYKYPNLIAEIFETGYSMCTLVDHMGLARSPQNEKLVTEKLNGRLEIQASEAFGLAKLFGCSLDYLFEKKLSMIGDVPEAYIRHYDYNKRQEENLKLFKLSEELRKTLKEKPYIAEFLKSAMSYSKEQIELATKTLQEFQSK